MKRFFDPHHKKVIFFDMNNTLLDQQQSFRKGFIQVMDEFTGRWSDETKKLDAKLLLAEYEKEWRRKTRRKETDRLPAKKLQLLCLRKVLRPYPFELSDAFLYKVIVRIKEQQSDHVQPFPDVANTLNSLSRNYQLAIISNSKREKQIANLKKIGLASMIPPERVFTPTTRKHRKPSPLLFQQALEALEVEAADAVMVGNSWKHDILGAARVGLDSVWLRHGQKKASLRPTGEKGKVIVIHRFKQLQHIF